MQINNFIRNSIIIIFTIFMLGGIAMAAPIPPEIKSVVV